MSAAFNTRPWRALRRRSRRLLRIVRERGPSQLQFWVLALLIGIGAGLAVLGFRLGTLRLQHAVYGADDVTLANIAVGLPWAWVLVAPVLGSLVVGIILDRFTPDARVRAISDVIEGAALHGGRVEIREGLASAAASPITLGTGGSSGREGPVVHWAGVVSTAVARRIKASLVTGPELLGCAVASAVAASFNAPIAGAPFAHEAALLHEAHCGVHLVIPVTVALARGAIGQARRPAGPWRRRVPRLA